MLKKHIYKKVVDEYYNFDYDYKRAFVGKMIKSE